MIWIVLVVCPWTLLLLCVMGVVLYSSCLFLNHPQRVVWITCLALKDIALWKGNYIRFSNQPWFSRTLCELDIATQKTPFPFH